MIISKLHTKGLGDNALGVRASKLDQFWDWVALASVGAESADTMSLMTEYPRAGDLVQSKYERVITAPTNGPWFIEIVEMSTGETIATGSTEDLSAEIAAVAATLAVINGDGDTAVDHNTAADGTTVADSMRVLYSGDPVDEAVIEVYQCTLAQYNAGSRGTVKARSETGVDGRWVRPVYLDAGFTYTVVIYKQGAFAAFSVEVVLP